VAWLSLALCPLRILPGRDRRVFSKPQSDVVLLKHRADDYSSKIPEAADGLLLIEVSDSTQAFDHTHGGNLSRLTPAEGIRNRSLFLRLSHRRTGSSYEINAT
jgi:hypothetical protein